MLRKYLSDGQKELEALHALEDLLERTERPRSECLAPSTLVFDDSVRQPCLSRASAGVLRLWFDVLFDEGIIKEETFQECKGAAEQSGRDLGLRSLTDFFDWLSK